MLIDIILNIFTTILWTLYAILQGLSYVIPDQIPQAFNRLFSYARVGDGILPISDMLLAITTVITAKLLLMTFKFLMGVYAGIPFFGKVINLPSRQESETITYDARGREINSRNISKRWMR